MPSIVCNNALGRVGELYKRVDTNSPVDSAFVIAVLAAAGIESDAVLKDKENLFDMLSGTTNEVTNTNYSRKILTDSDLVAMLPDHVNDRLVLDIPDQTFTAIAAGDEWAKVVICYDPDTTSGTNASIEPLTVHDFSKFPDGSDIIMTTPNGFMEIS